MYQILSKKTHQLKRKEIKKICILKDSKWKYGLESQMKWFRDNIKKNDIHNMFFIKNILFGYTLLRERKCIIGCGEQKYLLFDTLIILKSFRNKKLSYLIMNFDNKIIKQNKKMSFLTCSSNLIKFYKKFGWKKISKKQIKVIGRSFSTNGMIFNQKNSKSNFSFFTKK